MLQRTQQVAVERAHDAAPKAATPRASHVGNQAQLRRVEAKTAPAGLRVGPVDDPLEREADAVADRVMRMPEPGVALARAPLQVSRKCAACEEEDRRAAGQSANHTSTPVLRRKCAACEEETTVQRKAADPGAPTGTAPPIVNDVLRSPGQPLHTATRAFFEPRFGYDLSGVRVHFDGAAEQSARDVNAHAYSVGNDVVFGANQYAPGTTQGQALIAHELTHVLQQADIQRPVIRRRPATDEPPHKVKAAIVKIVAFEGSLDRAIAYLSHHPAPAPDDGATHTPEEVELTGNPLPAGNYTLQQTSGRFYRVLGARSEPTNKSPAPAAKEDLFRWKNPYLDESKKELKYAWAKSVDVEILGGYYKQFLAGDKSGKGSPLTTVQLVQTAEALHNAGVSTDELRREEERRLDVSRLGGTETPGDRVTWALDLAQQTLQQEDVARSTRGTLKFDLDRLAKIPPDYVGIVVTYLTDPTDANEKLAISDIDNTNRYTHPLWINFENKEDLWDTLRRFQRGFESEVRGLTEAVLNATESEILRVEDIFVGSWGSVKNPAHLRNELAKAKNDPEIISLRQKISEEETHQPSEPRRTVDTLASGLTTLVASGASFVEKAPKTETEEYEEKLAADREKLNQLVSEKTALGIGGLKGFNAEHLFDLDTHTAQFELAQVLAGGRNTILSARRHLHSDSQFVWGADKIIKGEEEQLGITQGSVLDQIVQGIVSAELSKKSLWEQIWEIIDFLINFLPIPPPAGPVLRAISAGVSIARAVDDYARKGLLNQASLSAYGPSASGLIGELVVTAAGTIIDIHASGVMHKEEEISRLRLEREKGTAGTPTAAGEVAEQAVRKDITAHAEVDIPGSVERHEVAVSGDAIGICSPPPCPNISLVYREDLANNQAFKERFDEIRKLAAQDSEKAASDAAALVEDMEKERNVARNERNAATLNKLDTGTQGAPQRSPRITAAPRSQPASSAELDKLATEANKALDALEVLTAANAGKIPPEALTAAERSVGDYFEGVRAGGPSAAGHEGGVNDAVARYQNVVGEHYAPNPNLASTSPRGGPPRANAPPLGESQIKPEQRSGANVDMSVQPHEVKTDFREAPGTAVQSAHLIPTAAARDLVGYSRSEAITSLMPRSVHRSFDEGWMKWSRAQSGKTVTVEEFLHVLDKAAEAVPELRGRTADTVSWLFRVEAYQTLGLSPKGLLRIPYS